MRLFIIAILIFSFPSPATRNQQKGQAKEQSSGAPAAPIPCSPVTVVINQATPEPQKETAQTKAHDWHEWFWPPVWSNWALVIVAAFAAKAAIETFHAIEAQTRASTIAAKAAEKSAKATEDSVNLQKVALRQWVNTRKWKAAIPDPDNRPDMMDIEFEVVNPTKAPMTLIYVNITEAGEQSEGTGFPQNMMLIPDNPLRQHARIKLTPEQLNSYYHSPDGLILTTEGSIIYMDALQDEWEQRFRLMLICHVNDTYMAEYAHTLHKVTKLNGANTS